MRIEALKSRWPGGSIAARESDIDDDSSPIALIEEIPQTREVRLAHCATRIDGPYIIPKRRPRRPDANPVEAVLLDLVQVLPEGIIRRAQSAVIADSQQESRSAVDGE